MIEKMADLFRNKTQLSCTRELVYSLRYTCVVYWTYINQAISNSSFTRMNSSNANANNIVARLHLKKVLRYIAKEWIIKGINAF